MLTEAPQGFTRDAALGRRLILEQPRCGHRFGHDAILLAAAVPAQPGDLIVDFGAGVGAAGLAVLRRVPGTSAVLAEIDPVLVACAERNIAANGFEACAEAVTLDVAAGPEVFAAAALQPGSAQHVLMNPPFNDPERLAASPDRSRAGAHMAGAGLLQDWLVAAFHLLVPRGGATVIWRADGLRDALAALPEGFGGLTLLPIYPRPNAAAIRVIIRVVKGGSAPLAVLPGLVLADAAGSPSCAAEAVLRNMAGLPNTAAEFST